MDIPTMAADTREWRGFRTLFLTAALWDLILGAAFFLFFRAIYDALHIPLPNNVAYIQMTAGFVFVQGAGYWLVYRDMSRNLDLVRLGVLYKAIYCGVAFYYLAIGQLPSAIFAWFAVGDVLFLLGFLRFIFRVRRAGPAIRA
jgi:hypothetical protein